MPKIEHVMWDGVEMNYYPDSGAIFNLHTGRIVANLGGSKYFDAKGMAEKRWNNVTEAIMEGLANASLTGIPQDMLAEIVEGRAILAASEAKRDGTEAAKFIFSLVGGHGASGDSRSSQIQIRLSQKMEEYMVDQMIGGGDEQVSSDETGTEPEQSGVS